MFLYKSREKMESLSEDLLPELLRALGDSTYSYAAGVRLSAVKCTLREVGARLPIVNDECETNVDQLVDGTLRRRRVHVARHAVRGEGRNTILNWWMVLHPEKCSTGTCLKE